jgi:hypothetical protein
MWSLCGGNNCAVMGCAIGRGPVVVVVTVPKPMAMEYHNGVDVLRLVIDIAGNA